MGGSEDTNPHRAPASSQPTPGATQYPIKDNGPGIQKTGEIMLILALVIIFIVCACIALHLVVRQRRRSPVWRAKKEEKRRQKMTKKSKKEQNVSELHSVDKKIFEAAGTQVVLAELAEAPPLQELEAGVFSMSIERAMTVTTTSDVELTSAISPEDPWPRGRELAVYWATR